MSEPDASGELKPWQKRMAAQAAAEAEVAAPPPDPIGDIIQAWFVQWCHDSPISRNTEAINHLASVLPHLKAALAKEA